MWHALLEQTQVGIKIAEGNSNNLRYVDDTTLMAESEQELKSLLMKEKSEEDGLKLNIQKTKIMASGPTANRWGNSGKLFKRWEYQTTVPASWQICMQVKKQQLEQDMGQQTGYKSGKEYVKAVYCHPGYLISMQSTSCEMPGWIKHKRQSRSLAEIPITSDTQMTPPLWQKMKRN